MAKIKFDVPYEIPQFRGTLGKLQQLTNDYRKLQERRANGFLQALDQTEVYLQSKKETMKKIQPNKVQSILCPKCKELQVKIFPWSSILIPPGMSAPLCRKCQAEKIK